MTKKEAEKLGMQEGHDLAENIHGDTPYERLAEVLQKYRKKKAWLAVLDQYAREIHQHRHKIPKDLMKSFDNGFVKGGIKEIEENIAHDIKTGYLKEK